MGILLAAGGNDGGSRCHKKHGDACQQKYQRDGDKPICECWKHDCYGLLHGKVAGLSCYERRGFPPVNQKRKPDTQSRNENRMANPRIANPSLIQCFAWRVAVPIHVAGEQLKGTHCGSVLNGEGFDDARTAQVTGIVQRLGGYAVGGDGVRGIDAEERNSELGVKPAQIELRALAGRKAVGHDIEDGEFVAGRKAEGGAVVLLGLGVGVELAGADHGGGCVGIVEKPGFEKLIDGGDETLKLYSSDS